MASAYETAVLASSPAVYLKCQETSGTTLFDSSGNGRNGTLVPNGTDGIINDQTAPSLPNDLGNNIRLMGGGSYILLDSSNWFTPASAGFTFEMWYNPRTYSANSRLFDFANTFGVQDMYFDYSFTDRLEMYAAGSSYVSYAVPDLNVWHHFAITVSSAGAVNWYFDGALYGSGTTGSPTSVARALKNVGKSNVSNGHSTLNASVSHIAVYNTVLSYADIIAHNRAARPIGDYLRAVQSDAPYAHWQFKESTGSFADTGNLANKPLGLSGGTAPTRSLAGPKGGGTSSVAVEWPNSSASYAITGAAYSWQVAQTVEIWFKIAALPATEFNLTSFGNTTSSNSASANPVGMWVTSAGVISFLVGINGGSSTTISSAASTITTGVWYHAVGSVSPTGAMKLRVNKTNVATGTLAGLIWVSQYQFGVHFGQHNAGGVVQVSNLAYYKGQLSDTQTDAHYDASDFTNLTNRDLTLSTYPAASSVAGAWPNTFSSFDTITRYEYQLDGGATTTTPSITAAYDYFEGLTNAAHTLRVRAVGSSTTSNWSNLASFTSDAALTHHQEMIRDLPLAYLPFDETSGNFTSWPRGTAFTANADRTGQPIVRNSTYSPSRDVANAAIAGNSTATYSNATGQTQEVWVTFPAGYDSSPLTSLLTITHIGMAGTGYGIAIGTNSNNMTMYASSGSNVLLNYNVPILSYDATYHFVLTQSGTTYNFYVNGRLTASFTNTLITAPTVGMWVGSRAGTGNLIPAGMRVDSAAFYDTALNPGRIKTHLRSGALLTAPRNLTSYPLNASLFAMHETVPGATRTEYSTDGGTTWSVPSYAQTINQDHPSIYYRLDETTGTTATDASGNGRNGTYSGSYTLNQTSALSSSLPDPGKSFTTPGGATGGGVALAHASFPANTATGSAEAWIKPTTVSPADGNGYKSILSKLNADAAASATAWGWSLHQNGANLELIINSSTNVQTTLATTNSPLQANVWQHVAWTYDGGLLRLYLNGHEVAVNPSVAIVFATATAASFRVGTNTQTARNFKGNIDEAAYFAYPCSPEQITKHYQAGLGNHTYTAILPSLTNGSTYTVRARVSNEFSGPSTAAIAAASSKPTATNPVVLVDKFDRSPSSRHPNHPDYSLGEYQVPGLGYFGVGNGNFLTSTLGVDQNFSTCVVPGPANVDLSYTVKGAAGAFLQSYGSVVRRISDANFWSYMNDGASDTRAQNPMFSATPLPLADDVVDPTNQRLRIIAYNKFLYFYRNNVLRGQVADLWYGSTYSSNGAIGVFSRRNYSPPGFADLVAYANVAPDMTTFPPTSTGFLYKGRLTHAQDALTYEP